MKMLLKIAAGASVIGVIVYCAGTFLKKERETEIYYY